MFIVIAAVLSGAAQAGEWDCRSDSIGRTTCVSNSDPEVGYTIKPGDGTTQVWATNDGDQGTADNKKQAHKAAREAIEENGNK